MGLGILEPKSSRPIPGTVTILEDQAQRITNSAERDPNLKYDKTGEYLLSPQPSDDPNDPLNWPLWKRDLILSIICLAAIIATTLSPILAADSLPIAFHFKLNFTKIALLTGYHLLGVGIGGIFVIPSARIWGKRHQYLLGTLLVCISSAWAGASGKNYTSLLWARIVQGIAIAPFEALVNASVGDLYFVHERGARTALSTLAVFGSAFCTPIVVGKISDTIGWKWSFYLVAIFSGILLPFLFLFCPETAYVRSASLNTDISGTNMLERNRPSTHGPTDSTASLNPQARYYAKEATQQTTSARSSSFSSPSKASFASTLPLFSGRKSTSPFWLLLLRPIPLFFSPSILWACLTQGTMIGWTVFIGIVLAAIFLAPPLYFSATDVGYLYTSAFVGALLGFVFCGLLADWSAKWLMKRNRGVFEPEFRLVLVVPQLVVGCMGIFVFGWTTGDIYRYGYIPPTIAFALVTFGMVAGAVSSSLYLIDAHRSIAIETFTCLMIFKNIFSFALTFKGYDWLIHNGPKRVFIAVGIVQAVICLLSVPMWVFGKKWREIWGRRDWLGVVGLGARGDI